MAERTCCQCGKPSPLGYDLCGDCDYAMATWWPITLGLSIRRFVRRCEVERLIIDVLDGIMPPTSLDERQTARHALDRLATLALEAE